MNDQTSEPVHIDPVRFPRPAAVAARTVLAAAVLSAAISAVAGGVAIGISVGVGVLMALGFLILTVSAVFAADRLDGRLALPTAFGSFLFCLLFVALIEQGVGDGGALRRVPLGLGVLGGALLWIVVHVVATLRARPTGTVAAR